MVACAETAAPAWFSAQSPKVIVTALLLLLLRPEFLSVQHPAVAPSRECCSFARLQQSVEASVLCDLTAGDVADSAASSRTFAKIDCKPGVGTS
jgi:hypothetical protein